MRKQPNSTLDLSAARSQGLLNIGQAALASGVAAFPVNRWLIARGRGHAVVHAHRGS
jgi:hypothetical protein